MLTRRDMAKIRREALGRVQVRPGNGMSIVPSIGGKPVISSTQSLGGEVGEIQPIPRSGLPVVRGNVFLLNLIPLRENAENLSFEIPFSNVKIYVRMVLTPVKYTTPGAHPPPDTFGIGYANVTDLSVVTGPHGVIPALTNASVSFSAGTESPGEYFFYCAKVFSDGTVMGLTGADGPDDLTYAYSTIVTIGWLPSPGGTHFPPIDLLP